MGAEESSEELPHHLEEPRSYTGILRDGLRSQHHYLVLVFGFFCLFVATVQFGVLINFYVTDIPIIGQTVDREFVNEHLPFYIWNAMIYAAGFAASVGYFSNKKWGSGA